MTPIAEADLAQLPVARLERAGPTDRPTRVGDPVALTLRDLPAGAAAAKLALPNGRPLLDAGWHGDGALRPDGGLELHAVRGGKLELPSLVVLDAGDRPLARTGALELDVESVARAGEEAAPPRPPVELEFPVAIALGSSLLGLALMTLIAWRIIRWWGRRPRPAAPPAPVLPEHEIALRRLDELAASGALEAARYKPLYFGISDLLKAYFGARWGFDAAESTTGELLGELRAAESRGAVTASALARAEVLFKHLDLIKFTDTRPEPADARGALAQARALILDTRRAEVAAAILPAGVDEGPALGGGPR